MPFWLKHLDQGRISGTGAIAHTGSMNMQTHYGLLPDAAFDTTLAGRAAVNARPAFRSTLVVLKDVVDNFASGKTKKDLSVFDAFRPQTFDPIGNSDTVQLIFATMAVNRASLLNLPSADASAVAAMLVMGLSSGLMAREQFRIDSRVIFPSQCDMIVDQWWLNLTDSSLAEFTDEEKKKVKEYMGSVLAGGDTSVEHYESTVGASKMTPAQASIFFKNRKGESLSSEELKNLDDVNGLFVSSPTYEEISSSYGLLMDSILATVSEAGGAAIFCAISLLSGLGTDAIMTTKGGVTQKGREPATADAVALSIRSATIAQPALHRGHCGAARGHWKGQLPEYAERPVQ